MNYYELWHKVTHGNSLKGEIVKAKNKREAIKKSDTWQYIASLPDCSIKDINVIKLNSSEVKTVTLNLGGCIIDTLAHV